MTQTEKALRLKTDEAWMDFALDEAKKAWRLSPPNPSVGAVIVKDGRLIGAGSTQQTGGPHAEIMALRDAEARGENVEGATVYVTLEPCSHWGRTPPCALALIQAKVARVVAATGDPNPKVCGRGLRMLEEAGVEVELGVREKEAKEVNVSFLAREDGRYVGRADSASRRTLEMDYGRGRPRRRAALARPFGRCCYRRRDRARRRPADEREA